MDTFRKWDKRAVEDDGAYMSKEARSFVTAFRNFLKRSFPECKVTVNAGHYDLFGFIQKGDNFIYVSYSIPRYGARIDFSATGAMHGVLYRTAKSDKDYTGGPNNFSSIYELKGNLEAMFRRMERCAA